MVTRAVLLVGGWAHPGDDLIASIRALVGERTMELVVVTDPLDAPAALGQDCDLLIVGACWFSMANDRYNAEQRDEYAVGFSPALASALKRLRDQGCPLLALHTAVICFDGDSLWTDWLGGTWNWATSWHPEPEVMEVTPARNARFNFESFTVTDELYQKLDVADSIELIAESAAGDPLVWLNQPEPHRARVAVNLLGHDHRSLSHPSHRALTAKLLDWLLAPR